MDNRIRLTHGIAFRASQSSSPPSHTLLISTKDTCFHAFALTFAVTSLFSWLRDSSSNKLLPWSVPTITPAQRERERERERERRRRALQVNGAAVTQGRRGAHFLPSPPTAPAPWTACRWRLAECSPPDQDSPSFASLGRPLSCCPRSTCTCSRRISIGRHVCELRAFMKVDK